MGWVGLGGKLGFAKLIAKLFGVREGTEKLESFKGVFHRGFPANRCRLVAKGNAGGFDDVLWDRVV